MFFIGQADGTVKKHNFDVFSYDLSHDAHFASGALEIALRKLLELEPALAKLSFWLDCGPHFRCREFLATLLLDVRAWHPQLTLVLVNFFAEHHGKSVCDAHFSHVSRAVKEGSKRQRINCIEDIIDACKLHFRNSLDSMTFVSFSMPSRSTIKQLKLATADGALKITSCYAFLSRESTIAASLFSNWTNHIVCRATTEGRADKRKSKTGPDLANRTRAPTFRFEDCIVGPLTRNKLLQVSLFN